MFNRKIHVRVLGECDNLSYTQPNGPTMFYVDLKTPSLSSTKEKILSVLVALIVWLLSFLSTLIPEILSLFFGKLES